MDAQEDRDPSIVFQYDHAFLQHSVHVISGHIDNDSSSLSPSSLTHTNRPPPPFRITSRSNANYYLPFSNNAGSVVCIVSFLRPQIYFRFHYHGPLRTSSSPMSSSSTSLELAAIAETKEAALQQILLIQPETFPPNMTYESLVSNTVLLDSSRVQQVRDSRTVSELFCYIGKTADKNGVINWRRNDLGLEVISQWGADNPSELIITVQFQGNTSNNASTSSSFTGAGKRPAELSSDGDGVNRRKRRPSNPS